MTVLRACQAHEVPALVAALDSEFVTGRGRTGSLASRYPQLFVPAALANIQVLRENAALVACAITRPFTWRLASRAWRGAMVGLVYTAPSFRGRGHGRRLLEAVVEILREQAFDVAVLWSGLDGFYERLGWQRGDCGMYGVVSDGPATRARRGAPNTPRRAADALAHARALHAAAAPPLAREALAWRARPLPVTHCHVAATARGYALYGVQGDRTYLYEMIGPAHECRDLWQQCRDGAREIQVNVAQSGPAYRWLTHHTPVRWQPQRLTFWYPLSAASRRLPLARWYVPYFDRI